MLYVWLIILVLLNTCWLGLIFFALPGNWLMVISTALLAWWRWDDGIFSVYTLIAITILAVLGEVIEFFAGAGGAKKAGAGKAGAIGAVLGAIAGAVAGTILIPIPIIGTLMGGCLGAGLGAFAFERARGREMADSIRLGTGAGLGQLLGITGKFIIGIIIWLTITITAFWPGG